MAACASNGGPVQEAAFRPSPQALGASPGEVDATPAGASTLAAVANGPDHAGDGALDAGSRQPPALPAASFSTSLGSPTNGRVLGSVALPLEGPGFRFNSRRDSGARYGTVEVIGTIERAASTVRGRFPDSELVVNDIGLAEGGTIPHHGSHRAGRDADILFYLRGDDGAPTPSVGAPLDPAGIGFDFKELSDPADDVRVHFDAERTWHFVAALLEDAEARVQRIFVVEHLRSALLAAARRAHAQAETVARFEDVTCQPSYPHDDHLHVR
ncbi:MAG TPA: penicillin-insensitive murein endopeptidase, partial [Polyangiales bacterium]